MSEKSFDVVLFGATGFTGRLVAERLRDHAPATLRWAIGGRDREKLEAVRLDLGLQTPIVVADSADRASLDALVAKARVVATTVGPYARHGTPLVASCVEHGVDYCDLTGETPWMRETIDTFHDRAAETGARIVHTCGFDSIPSDLGVLTLQDFARRRHGGPCREIRLVVTGSRGGVSGGTVASMVGIVEQVRRDPQVRRVLGHPYALNPPDRRSGPDGRDPAKPAWDADLERWTAPFFMGPVNTRVVRRSNALLGDAYGRDFRYAETMAMPNRVAAWGVTAAIGGFLAGVAFGPTRALLERFVLPAPGEGPSREKIEGGWFRMKLVGRTASGARVLGRVEDTRDPGYGSTAKMLAESALCLALDPRDGPGGVLTPASSMGLRLVERLRRAGMVFSAEDWD